jgi:hypothetical protein
MTVQDSQLGGTVEQSKICCSWWHLVTIRAMDFSAPFCIHPFPASTTVKNRAMTSYTIRMGCTKLQVLIHLNVDSVFQVFVFFLQGFHTDPIT